MSNQFLYAGIFLIKTISDLVLLLFILRIALQIARADFFNPMSQFVFRVTNPLVAPLHRVVPRTRLVDIPAVLVLLAVTAATNLLLIGMAGMGVTPAAFVLFMVVRAAKLAVYLYLISIFIDVLLSWIGQRGYHPMSRALSTLVAPVLDPFRRLIPPIGGLDLSPLVAILVLQTIAILLPPLPGLLR
jgi:YggT family protein